MRFQVVTLFPVMIEQALKEGVVGQAVSSGQVQVATVNPRDFTCDVHHSVDDRPFGGGDGMVMMLDPLLEALKSLGEQKGRVVYLSPQGRRWNDSLAREWAKNGQPVTLICGRYAGVDQRFINAHVDEEISIGDYVLSGGELAALVMIDTVSRLMPGVLGNPKSAGSDSFAQGLLEGPVYTRPREHALGAVPATLLSGHHAKIETYRQALALALTALKRPDLLHSLSLDAKVTLKSVPKAAEQLLALPEEELKSLGLSSAELKSLLEI